MRGRAEIIFELPDSEVVLNANGLLLTVEGDDVVSLRAALNTWLRLVRICVEMIEI